MAGKIVYFGYGANRTPEMISWITGKSDLKGKQATISGWILGIQKLNQVPNTPVPTSAGPKPLRKHLQAEWGDDFETYVIIPEEGKVKGTLWEITPKERELIRSWERVGFWYKETKVKALTDDNLEIDAITERLGDNQSFDRKADGMNYDSFLFPKATLKLRAEEARIGYYKRMRGK